MTLNSILECDRSVTGIVGKMVEKGRRGVVSKRPGQRVAAQARPSRRVCPWREQETGAGTLPLETPHHRLAGLRSSAFLSDPAFHHLLPEAVGSVLLVQVPKPGRALHSMGGRCCVCSALSPCKELLCRMSPVRW